MKHLLSYSVYQDLELFGQDAAATLAGIGCDGLELLTSFEEVPQCYAPLTETVHLPYAPDWLAAWEDRPYDTDDKTALFLMYGKSREELLDSVARSIRMAEPLRPGHGVMHACNADLPCVRKHGASREDAYVIEQFCDMMNQVAERFPGGEPPFKIVFENLWWPGMRLTDNAGFRLVQDLIEFDNWGICLDTGHLMSTIPRVYTEQDGIEGVMEIVSGYDEDLLSRLSAVHFHFSASGEYRETFEEVDMGDTAPVDFYWGSYKHVSAIDQHRAFTDPSCRRIIETVSPDYVIHELPGKINGPLNDFRQQRSLLP